MRSSESSGVALVAAAADADWVTRLVLAWLAAKRSPNTRAAYACDIGITPPQRTSRAASWLAWCQAEGVHPVTGITGLHVTQYARQLDDARLSAATAARKLAAVAVLLFTGARVSEVIGADVEDLGTDQGRPVLWVSAAFAQNSARWEGLLPE